MPVPFKVTKMDDYEIKVEGAPVVFTNLKPPPYNPLRRPKIHYGKPIVAAAIWLVCILAMAVCGAVWFPKWALWICLGFSLIYFSVIAKRALIWCVHLYQNKASDATRLKCVFEPSCSEYMILSINKYGVLRGVWKGIRRLLRCHSPNGGVDFP